MTTTTNSYDVARLYLGRAVPGSEWPVTDVEMRDFIAEHVAPKLPGWSQYNASGGWVDVASGKTITEPTTVLEVWIPVGDAVLRQAVAQIGDIYKLRFRQDCVTLSISRAELYFL